MRILALAWRNLWRNRRRTVVTTGAMTLALFVTILYASLVEGMLVMMERDALDTELGSVQVFAAGFRDRPSLYHVIDDAEELVAKLHAAGLPASARLLGTGLIASGESSAAAQLRGVDLATEPAVLDIARQVEAGRWLDETDLHGAVLGRRLAHTLGVGVGAELVALSQAADGSIANDLFHVCGILRSVGEATDRAGVFLPAATFREFFALERGAHQIIVRRPAELPLATMLSRVRALAPEREVHSWRQLVPLLASMLDSTQGMMTFFFLIIYVAIAVVILNAMLMAVFERIKELGVLKALGFGPAAVLRLIFAESMFQVGIAVVLGVVLSLPALWYLSSVGIDMGALAGVSMAGLALMSRWQAVIHPGIFATPIVLLVVVVGLAVLYPALKAALIRPIDAMHHS